MIAEGQGCREEGEDGPADVGCVSVTVESTFGKCSTGPEDAEGSMDSDYEDGKVCTH